MTLSNEKIQQLKNVFWEDPSRKFAPGSQQNLIEIFSRFNQNWRSNDDSDWENDDSEDNWEDGDSEAGTTLEEDDTVDSNEPFEYVNMNVRITDVKVDTKYDPDSQCYRSWVHFDITHSEDTDYQGDYSTVFKLPEDCFISNYYLYVGHQKKYGILADKRAAEWIFQKIVNVRKDPGLLTYRPDNKILFRVFPFEPGETRKTGFEVLHKSNKNLKIDDWIIRLNAPEQPADKVNFINQNVVYVPAKVKASLPLVSRKPQYHFVVDFSDGNQNNITYYFESIRNFVRTHQIDPGSVNVSAVNLNFKTVPYTGNWEQKLGRFRIEGGLYLDRFFKYYLYQNFISRSKTYPVFIVVTDKMQQAVLGNSYRDLKFTFPETDLFYSITEAQLYAHSLISKSTEKVNGIPTNQVLAFNQNDPQAYLANDERDSLVLLTDKMDQSQLDITKTTWENGVLLRAMYLQKALHPEADYEKSMSIIKSSFASRIMTPLTSYIVLETEAQEKALFEKQKQIMAVKKAFDANRTVMDEPPAWMVFLIFLGGLLIIKRQTLLRIKGI